MNNLSMGEFYLPREIEPRYEEVAEAYIEAFKGYPWFEVSQCAIEKGNCVGGFSPLEIGNFCKSCGLCPSQPAYSVDDLTDKFQQIGIEKDACWYIEEVENKIALAALAWVGDCRVIATEKYSDQPLMSVWTKEKLGSSPLVWLDEVFADKRIRKQGNLTNFSQMLDGFSNQFNNDRLAYRTITPQMIRAGEKSGLLVRRAEKDQVPDRRDFVTNIKEMR